MKTLLSRLGILYVLLFVLAVITPLEGAAPNGTFNYGPFDGAQEAIWNLSGTYTIEQEIYTDLHGYVDLVFTVNVTQDGKGKAYGSGNTTIRMLDGASVVEQANGTYTLKGKVKNSGDISSVSASIKVTGTDFIFGGVRKFNVTIKYKFAINPDSGYLEGISKGKAAAKGVGSTPIEGFVEHILPPGMDGSWDLSVMFQSDGKKLFGAASVELSNGLEIPLAIKGNYSEKTDQSKVQLTGSDAFKGSKIKLLMEGSSPLILDLKGKVLGQKLD